MHTITQGARKYLSTSEMVTGLRKKTNDPIPHLTIPGDFRIYRPSRNDVLCGRGKPIQDHWGNLRMRRIIAMHAHRYLHARKHKKQHIVEEVVELVKSSDGVLARFLKRVGRENYWVEVPTSVACDKVSHGLRCFVRKSETCELLESYNESQSDIGDDSSCIPSTTTTSVIPHDVKNAGDILHPPQGSVIPEWMVVPQVMGISTTLSPEASSNSTLKQTIVRNVTNSRMTGIELQEQLSLFHLSNAQLIEMLARERIAKELSASQSLDLEQQELVQQLALEQAGKQRLAEQLLQQQRQEDSQKLTLALLVVVAAGGAGCVHSGRAVW